MAIISVVISDNDRGETDVKFVSTEPLPDELSQYTPAQLFAAELYKELGKLKEGV